MDLKEQIKHLQHEHYCKEEEKFQKELDSIKSQILKAAKAGQSRFTMKVSTTEIHGFIWKRPSGKAKRIFDKLKELGFEPKCDSYCGEYGSSAWISINL